MQPMKPLSKDQYHSIQRFYSDNYPNRAFIDGVIEGILPGKIWVDDKSVIAHSFTLTKH